MTWPDGYGAFRNWFGNQEFVVNWQDDGRELHSFESSALRNSSFYFKPIIGRPRKSFQERFAYFTSTIEDCRNRISEGESRLDLVHLQLRYLKRLRDHATRIRLQIKNALGPELVALKIDLTVVEKQLKVEAGLFNEYQDNYVTMSREKIESIRNSVIQKIKAFDSVAFSAPTHK